jgi:hypothetical protein
VGWLSKYHHSGSSEDVANPYTAIRDGKGNRIFRPRYSHKDVFRIDTTTDADRARVQSPKLSFRSDVSPIKAFRWIINLLDRCGFDWVLHYSGPDLGLEVKDGDIPSIELIRRRLKEAKPGDVPFGGMKADLVYKKYQRIRAKVKVSGNISSKVKVRVKGPVLKADWREFQRLVRKRFDVDL